MRSFFLLHDLPEVCLSQFFFKTNGRNGNSTANRAIIV